MGTKQMALQMSAHNIMDPKVSDICMNKNFVSRTAFNKQRPDNKMTFSDLGHHCLR